MRVLSITLALGSIGLLLANLITLENSVVIMGLSIVVLVLDRFN